MPITVSATGRVMQCPPLEDLAQLVEGSAPAATLFALAFHLNRCPMCFEIVELVMQTESERCASGELVR